MLNKSSFQRQLLSWAATHGRHDLPWQQQPTPYHVWLSETMLQQTQVKTVIPYFHRFIATFPRVEHLAQGSLEQVLALWTGLGYYARAKRLHQTAQIITNTYSGQWPSDIDTLIGLPGIGRSTAGAIRALAFDRKASILDGNVKRVLCRYHAYQGDINKTAACKQLWQLADNLVPEQHARAYTQAMMDLGAICCTQHQPKCEQCPVHQGCQARAAGLVASLPYKAPRRPKTTVTYPLLLLHHQRSVLLVKRPEQGIWANLWCLPVLDDMWQQWLQQHGKEEQRCALPPMKHVLTHRHLRLQPYLVTLDEALPLPNLTYFWYKLDHDLTLGTPKPVTDLLKQIGEHEQIRLLSKT